MTEMERMRREEAYSSRGRKDGRRGEGCQRVKGLSTGHPLTWGQAQKTPQEACFLCGEREPCCTWTDTKEGQAAGGTAC